jgi:hypothetical protein
MKASEPIAPLVSTKVRETAGSSSDTLGKCPRALLTVLAQRRGLNTTSAQLGILSGYSITSSSFANAVGSLRSAGYATGSRDNLAITNAGTTVIGPVPEMPTGRELVEQWMGRLGKAECSLLQVIYTAHPRSLSREQVAEQSGYSLTSSSFANALGRLRTLELIERGSECRLGAALAEAT